MDTTHSIHSGLKHDGLSSEAEEDVRMHYTEIITYLTSLSKHPGLDVVFDFQMLVYPTNQRPLAWATDEISEIPVVHEDERDTVREPQAPGAEVLANIERAHKEDIEAVEARWKREMEGLRDQLRAAEAGCEKKCHDANRRGYAMGYAFADEKATKAFQAMRADLQRLTAENKELREQIEEDKQMVQRHLKEIAKEHAQMTAWEKKEIERLTEENKRLERRVAEESHWCKDANLAARTAEMHAQMLRTDVAQLQKENEGLRKLVFPSLNLEAASSGVKVEPELAPKFPQVVQASPQLVAALKAEKTWEAGTDVCYVLTKKDYEAIVKAQGPLPSVEVVEDDVDLELLQKMVSAAPLPPSPPSSPPLAPDYPVCGVGGWLCYECAPEEPEPEPKPKPNYNHHFWPSPTTKRFAKHLAKLSGLRSPWVSQDPKTIKTHEDALEYIAKRAKISVETLLGYSIKQYQTSFEPWSLPGEPWAPENPHAFVI